MKLIVAGGRNFSDFDLLKKTLDEYLRVFPDLQIVSGKARGADSLGEKWAKENNIRVFEFPADWSRGKKAGYERNLKMANFADQSLCFWDSVSKGTKHMIDISKSKGIHCRIVYYDR